MLISTLIFIKIDVNLYIQHTKNQCCIYILTSVFLTTDVSSQQIILIFYGFFMVDSYVKVKSLLLNLTKFWQYFALIFKYTT